MVESEAMTGWGTGVKMAVPTAICFMGISLSLFLLVSVCENLDLTQRNLPCSKSRCENEKNASRIEILEIKVAALDKRGDTTTK